MEKELRSIIKFQLGREPHNLKGVALYCPFYKPAVLVTNPFSKEHGVFPTTYWLSCPYLVKEVSRLEDKGLIRELTDRLQSDPDFKEKMERAHTNYRRQRMKLLQDDFRDDIESLSPDIIRVLKKSGVGGIRDKEGIKCLHTHLADYLVHGQNPAGEIVWKKLDWPEECDLCYSVF